MKNSKGFATMFMVVVLSLILVTSLLTIYIYIVNRARYQARIRESYQLQETMEEASKTVRSTWDNAATSAMLPTGTGSQPCCQPSATCAAGCNSVNCGPQTPACSAQIAQATTAQFPLCKGLVSDAACCSTCKGLYGGNIYPDVCTDNPNDAVHPFCFYGVTTAGNTGSSQARYKPRRSDFIRNFYARLDEFFEKMPTPGLDSSQGRGLRAPGLLAWAMNEQRAMAAASPTPGPNEGAYGGPTAYHGVGLQVTNCSSTSTTVNGAQCISCGAGTGRQCIIIGLCPWDYSNCQTWNPALGFGPGATEPPPFAQEFSVSAPGTCTVMPSPSGTCPTSPFSPYCCY